MKLKVHDFNNLTLKELLSIEGIGRKTANRIIERRSKYSFNTIKDLLSVNGLGKTTLARVGIKSPPRGQPKEDQTEELMQFVSNYKLRENSIKFSEWPNNKKVKFWEDCTDNTCQRSDLLRSNTMCNTCSYVLICKCDLRKFVSDNGKKRTTPTKKLLKEIVSNIDNYKHYQQDNGSVDLSMCNLPEELIDD
jgi:competence ComEA-like helix-hairpin-helix protein